MPHEDPDARVGAGRHRLLTLLECAGPLTRSELTERMGLPGTTVAGMVSELLRARLVVERETPARGVGRPPRVLEPAGPAPVVSLLARRDGRLRVAVATLSGGLIAERSRPVDDGKALDAPLLAEAARLLRSALGEAGISPPRLVAVVVSVARPRPHDVDLSALGERLEKPVVPENDANLGALGEAEFGAGRGLDSFVYVMLGHSVGAGLVVGGRLHRGASGFAGELGHVQVQEQEDGSLCVCGGRGCLGRHIGTSLHDFVHRAYAARLSVPEVLSLAARREPGVRRVFADLGRMVGKPLAGLCTMLDPAAVVVDGSLGAAGEPVMAGIREELDRHAAPAVADSVRVVAGELGERAELLGAVALVRRWTLDATLPASRRDPAVAAASALAAAR
jgi:predicted NBD/HSP70 family sugar kinase